MTLETLERDLREWRIKRNTADATIKSLEQQITVLKIKGRKCQMCGKAAAEIAWQPFGPAENCRDGDAFMRPGSHHRGFPVLKICHDCAGNIQNGERMSFEYGRDKTVYYLVGELTPMTRKELDLFIGSPND